ncbi:MAG: VWA domain-containing protein [Bacteroidales bacterium]|jgi:hypothetical protein|nr:VWA domain-containing protein [Bacteroidales bacterium]
MKKRSVYIALLMLAGQYLVSCSTVGDSFVDDSPAYSESSESGDNNDGDIYNIPTPQPGVLTAGEWNDLDNWSFWNNILADSAYKSMPDYWKFYTNNRVSLLLTTPNGSPLANAVVELQRNGVTVFATRTDNRGKAELWTDIFQKNTSVDYSGLTLLINGVAAEDITVKPFTQGVNEITVVAEPPANRIEIALVVDATGSMGDELEYIKTELTDVIGRVKGDNATAEILTSAVFYRDKGDDYVTRVSGFSNDVSVTGKFIKAQSADGGGDFPEAVHTALDKASNELQWSDDAKTRLMFLILDAPPHYESDVIKSIQTSVKTIAEKGIKIIPITASGINKETEFLMRFLATITNGTYVFITDDSGVGNKHLTPTVGEYQVEYLNDLMVRLINKYSE